MAHFSSFALLELILVMARDVLGSRAAVSVPGLMAHIKSLQSISNADWPYLIEPLILFEEFLRQDPAKAYEQINFESRELYRKRIALIARRLICSEFQVAQIAIQLARQGNSQSVDPR